MITTGVLAAPAEEVEEFFVRNRSAALTQIIDLALLDNDVVATVVGETDCLFRIDLLLRDMASSYRDDWAKLTCMGLAASSPSCTPPLSVSPSCFPPSSSGSAQLTSVRTLTSSMRSFTMRVAFGLATRSAAKKVKTHHIKSLVSKKAADMERALIGTSNCSTLWYSASSR